MDGCAEAAIGLVVARGDAAEFLDITEEVLDQMPPSVHGEIAWNAAGTVGLGWDNGRCASVIQFGANPVDIERLVGKKSIELDAGDQRGDADAIVALARQ